MILTLASFLFVKIHYRKRRLRKKLVLAKTYGVDLIQRDFRFDGEPNVFKSVLGICTNAVCIGGEKYIFEYHYKLMTAGQGRLDKVVDMVIDLSFRQPREKAMLSDRVFYQHLDIYPENYFGYQCTEFDNRTLNYLRENDLSLLFGGWGLIVIPGGGEVEDVEKISSKVESIKKLLLEKN